MKRTERAELLGVAFDTVTMEAAVARVQELSGIVFDPRVVAAFKEAYLAGELKGDPEASASAQLRHLRKPRFGSHTVEKRNRGAREFGLWEYRLTLTAS